MTHDAPLPGLCLPSSHPASQRTAARSSGHQRLIATWKSEGSQRVHPEFLCALGWCKLRRYRELGVGHCAPLEAVVYHMLVKCLKAMRIPELVDYFSYSRNLFYPTRLNHSENYFHTWKMYKNTWVVFLPTWINPKILRLCHVPFTSLRFCWAPGITSCVL